jgi:GT2 family glycosyltransferase
MKLSIVILHTNKPQDATQCLRSLQNTRLPAETEIFCINNGGQGANDRVDRAAAEGLPVTFMELPRDGYVYGNNQGYKASTGDFIATVNADITMHEDTMEKLLDYMERHPDVGIAAPRLVYPDGLEQDSARPFPKMFEIMWRRIFKPDVHRQSTMVFRGEAEDVDWITGAMFLMSRKCLEATGGHDERYFLFMSDITMCREAWSHGMRVAQLRDAKAIHNEHRLSKGGVLKMLKKRTGRAHIKDAATYFLRYGWRRAPAGSPSSGKPLSHA